jgi:hypothetical protein
MESMEPKWNEARMDEFAERTDRFAERTDENFREVRIEIRAAESGLRSEMNERFGKLEATFNRRFDILFSALAMSVVGIVVSHLLG